MPHSRYVYMTLWSKAIEGNTAKNLTDWILPLPLFYIRLRQENEKTGRYTARYYVSGVYIRFLDNFRFTADSPERAQRMAVEHLDMKLKDNQQVIDLCLLD